MTPTHFTADIDFGTNPMARVYIGEAMRETLREDPARIAAAAASFLCQTCELLEDTRGCRCSKTLTEAIVQMERFLEGLKDAFQPDDADDDDASDD